MINANKLKGRMVEKRISQQQAARALGIQQPTFSQKCNGVREFKVGEVQRLVKLLEIPDEEVTEYFFVQ